MANITGIFLLDVGITKTPRNNVTATLCAASGFISPPQKNDAIPSGSVIAAVTTGSQYGGDGQYAFYSVPAVSGGYYVALDYAGSRVWDDHTGYSGGPSSRAIVITLMEGFTPSAASGDVAEVVAPYSPADGTTVLTYNVRRITWRVSGVGTLSGSVTIQKSSAGNAAFSPTTVGTVTLAAADYQGSVTSALGTVQSGDAVRAYINTLGDKTGWFLSVLMESQT